jgi:hypothetical protein
MISTIQGKFTCKTCGKTLTTKEELKQACGNGASESKKEDV